MQIKTKKNTHIDLCRSWLIFRLSVSFYIISEVSFYVISEVATPCHNH